MSASTKTPRLFGTDGVRGRAGEGWLTTEKAALLARAIGEELGANMGAERRALVGHDGRRSGPELEKAVADGLKSAGFGVVSAGLIPTPGLAVIAKNDGFDLAVMLSASHNPAEDNGIKVFGGADGKLSDEEEDRIEARVRADQRAVPESSGPRHDETIGEQYLNLLINRTPSLSLVGKTIAIDCANGAGSEIGPELLRRLGARVIQIGCAPDGSNINQGVGSTHPEALQAAVVKHEASLGIALDGDGDRCLLIDENGELVDGDGIMAICGLALARSGELPSNRLVATVMSNKGLAKALRTDDVTMQITGVGDRRVVEALRAGGYGLGGEQSGHIVFGEAHDYVGDGLYTALRVLAILEESKTTLSRAASVFTAFPQVLINVPVKSKPPFETLGEVAQHVENLERELGDDGRVLLRYSGTESLARVMVEGPDLAMIQREAEAIGAEIAKLIG